MSLTPLAGKLRRLIDVNGPLTVAQYMAHCLGDPEYGYYMTRDPFGAGGDFITAPEVSQMFGEIVGAWLVHAWRLAGAPPRASLVELGPGRGTLMADILRVAARVPEFCSAVSIHLVETSPVLMAQQAKRLDADRITWHAGLGEIPDGPLILVANEFFDALPIRQFVRRGENWCERLVGWRDGRFAFGIGPGRLPGIPAATDGSIQEVSPAREALAADIGGRIARDGGAALIIDYGYAESGPGDTLQALRAHRSIDPLETPGEADLTAHVDFGALGRAAAGQGATVHGPIAQGEFLLSLGLQERAARLGTEVDETDRVRLAAAVDRLAGPHAMGTLFKVMALTGGAFHPPPFPAAGGPPGAR